MPYSVGEKGSYGCSGYPVVKDGTSDVMGCHETREKAVGQIAAIEANENYDQKEVVTSNGGVGIKNPQAWPNTKIKHRKPKLVNKEDQVMNEDFSDEEMDTMSKADSYSPTSGMKSAARRALKWKEDGKAKGAGTPVGWGRASDIVAGRSMSLSVVKRMYSFFSRHEVDKKGKGFYDGPDFPSKGRVMWDAWGGDAGFSWSRKIAERESKKADFSDFAKDVTKVQQLTEVFKAESVRVGQMVSWNSSGGTARGKVKRIITSGSYNVPGTEVTVTGTKEDPAAVITLYRNGEPTDTIVAHKVKTLRAS